MVFSMQGLGLIMGPLVAIVLLTSGFSQDLTWRLMLGFGAIPALATFYLRRKIAETPRFTLMMNGDLNTATQTAKHATSNKTSQQGVAPRAKQQAQKSGLALLLSRRYLRWIIGTAGAWFLLDIAYYGSTTSNTLILKMLNPHADQVTNMVYMLLIFLIAALPGYILAALTIDRMGRKTIQCMGFGVMALTYTLLALVPALSSLTIPFLALYGIGYLFTEWGPNTTTFVYPAEIFSVRVRSSAHGIAAGLGKVGAFVGAFAFPYLLAQFHIQGTMAFAAVVALLGLILTFFTLPEPNGRSLEEISGDLDFLSPPEKQLEQVR
jgi:MFS transporter, PHS family, inorganic phosphate transporter